MGEFITLTCPSCGGKLQVSPNTSVLNCQHCGTEHLVRRDAGGISLESFARCPMCGRNDRVEKVSAIMKSQTQEFNSIEQQTELFYDQQGRQQTRASYVPVRHSQLSSLAQQLLPPVKPVTSYNPIIHEQKPIHKNVKLMLAYILLFFGVLTLFSTLCAIFGVGFQKTMTQAWFFVIVIIVLITSGGYLLINNKKANQKEKNDISQKNKQMFDEWNRKNIQAMNRWQSAIENWNKLYYCHRDDCVFIPNEGSYAPVERMREYIYQGHNYVSWG